MDSVSRLIRWLVFGVLCASFMSAQAAYIKYPGPYYDFLGNGSFTEDPGTACQQWTKQPQGWDSSCTVAKTGGPGSEADHPVECTATCASGYSTKAYPKKNACPNPSQFQVIGGVGVCVETVAQCPSGASPDANGFCGDAPACPSGQTRDSVSGQCVPVKCSSATLGDASSKWYWKGKGSTTCQSGCLYIADQFAYDKESGYSIGWGRLNGLGSTCTTGQESAGDNPPDNKPPNKCDPGKCMGTVNGVAVCVKCGNGGSVDTKTETSTKDSGEEGGDSGQTTTSTTSKTTCEDGKCVTETTTSTSSSSGGTKSETTKEEQSQDSFCSKNPDHALCKEQKSEFSGGCASGFRCEGDAVQCAMAREQHERMCQLLDNETDLSKLGNRIGTGQDDQDTKNRLGNGDSPIDISTGFASARPVGPTSGCPADVSVGQWTIPFSRMCPHLNTLGNALVGLAYLVGALIVFRRGGSD